MTTTTLPVGNGDRIAGYPSTLAVATAVPGVTYRILDYWCRTGVFDSTPGSGARRRWTPAAVRVVRFLGEATLTLRALGCPGLPSALAAELAAWLRDHPEATTIAVRADVPEFMADGLVGLEVVAGEDHGPGSWLIICPAPEEPSA